MVQSLITQGSWRESRRSPNAPSSVPAKVAFPPPGGCPLLAPTVSPARSFISGRERRSTPRLSSLVVLQLVRYR